MAALCPPVPEAAFFLSMAKHDGRTGAARRKLVFFVKNLPLLLDHHLLQQLDLLLVGDRAELATPQDQTTNREVSHPGAFPYTASVSYGSPRPASFGGASFFGFGGSHRGGSFPRRFKC